METVETSLDLPLAEDCGNAKRDNDPGEREGRGGGGGGGRGGRGEREGGEGALLISWEPFLSKWCGKRLYLPL